MEPPQPPIPSPPPLLRINVSVCLRQKKKLLRVAVRDTHSIRRGENSSTLVLSLCEKARARALCGMHKKKNKEKTWQRDSKIMQNAKQGELWRICVRFQPQVNRNEANWTQLNRTESWTCPTSLLHWDRSESATATATAWHRYRNRNRNRNRNGDRGIQVQGVSVALGCVCKCVRSARLGQLKIVKCSGSVGRSVCRSLAQHISPAP